MVCNEKIEYPETTQHDDVFYADKSLLVAYKFSVDVIGVHASHVIQAAGSMLDSRFAPRKVCGRVRAFGQRGGGCSIKRYHESRAVSNME